MSDVPDNKLPGETLCCMFDVRIARISERRFRAYAAPLGPTMSAEGDSQMTALAKLFEDCALILRNQSSNRLLLEMQRFSQSGLPGC